MFLDMYEYVGPGGPDYADEDDQERAAYPAQRVD
jgi:hypothetical protein